jgi:hypothetical protein
VLLQVIEQAAVTGGIMARGWIRAYAAERAEVGFSDADFRVRNDRAEYRRDFRTDLHETASGNSDVLRTLRWGEEVELPSGIASGRWTRATFSGDTGYVRTAHIVELAYVDSRPDEEDGYTTDLTYQSGGREKSVKLIWGDCVQILERDEDFCLVRARGFQGQVATDHLVEDALLCVYFIDVGQGDGVLVSTPDGRHLLVDGGLERTKQHTGKNAADFVDWKFYKDYGDFRVRLDSLMASHSDNDHYGGLHDLVRENFLADRELDCLGVDVETFHHPGLSRWENRPGANTTHHDGLGPRELDADFNYFVRLLEDRDDAEEATTDGSPNELSGPWRYFVRDVLRNSEQTDVARVGVAREALQAGDPLPDLWNDTEGYEIKVLGPVTVDRNGGPGLPDFGPKSYNTNGHSICLRLDIGVASILLTGDLNKPSMDWLASCYGERMGAWLCDVAKACHHGSHKISYRFIEAMRPAATVISSGDAEGHAHPRPEIVGASAVAGRVEVDRDRDVLITPLVYMTEIERSVSLGAVQRLDFWGVPAGEDEETQSGQLLGRHFEATNDKVQLSEAEVEEIDALPAEQQAARRNELRAATRARFRAQEEEILQGGMRVRVATTVPQGPLGAEFKWDSFWRARVMDKNHYGLVNVRTDGTTVMCATLDETDEDWIMHTFPARTRLAEE